MNIKKSDLITTDGYLSFCNDNNITYLKTDYFYTGPFIWRGNLHPDKEIKNICVVGHSDYPVVDKISEMFKYVFCVNRVTDCDNTFGIPIDIDFSNLSYYQVEPPSIVTPFILEILGAFVTGKITYKVAYTTCSCCHL